MYQRIHDILYRQYQGLQVLTGLLDEEYDLLRTRQTKEVVTLEFAVQELIRQLAQEKTDVRDLLKGGKVIDYAQLLPEEQGNALRALFKGINDEEQKASRNASRNAQMSLALLDQSQRTMHGLHSQIIPKTTMTYGRRGVMGAHRPQAALISGRL